MQTDDLVALTKSLGVAEENIILYLENKRDDGTMKNASGRLRIDQREGLSALVERIESDEIKAVVVFLEDRLFRDETQIEVNKFILVCREHGTIVTTPFMTYDFRNPYHVKQFRWKCEQAADFLREYIRERLHKAVARNSSEGKYDGRTIPVGYIVDRRKEIGGVPNPQYKKLMEYKPHAEVVTRIFLRYISISGRAKKLYNELLKIPVLFPDFEKDVDPRNVKRLLLKKVPGGYHISFQGLLGLLTNVVYIGWWMHNGDYLKYNHTAIVDEDVFWFAFYRISDYTPDGRENEERENRKARFTREGKPEPSALLNGIIETNEAKKAVYVGYRFSDWYYIITWRNNTAQPVFERYSVLVDHVDEAFRTAFYAHMENTRDFEDFRNLAKTIQEEEHQEQQDQEKELARIDKRMQATLVSLTEDPDLPSVTRKALNHIYAELVEQKKKLLNQPEKPTRAKRVTLLLAYHNLLERLKGEEKLHFDDVKLLAQATTRKVTLDGLSPHFSLLTIVWRTPVWGTDTALLWRPYGRSPFWKDDELAIMETQYACSPQEELLELLPQRSWHSISQQAGKMGLMRAKHPCRDNSMLHVSLEDRTIMQEYGLTQEELSSDNQIIWR